MYLNVEIRLLIVLLLDTDCLISRIARGFSEVSTLWIDTADQREAFATHVRFFQTWVSLGSPIDPPFYPFPLSLMILLRAIYP